MNVPQAVRRGRSIRCRHCQQKGATVGCFHRTCQTCYHLPCAKEVGCELRVSGCRSMNVLPCSTAYAGMCI